MFLSFSSSAIMSISFFCHTKFLSTILYPFFTRKSLAKSSPKFPKIPEFPKNQWFAIAHPEIAFPKDWVNRPVGVIFDYGPNGLIFLMKGRYKGKAICSNFLQRDAVINLLTTNASLFIHGVEEHLKIIIDKKAEQKRKMQSQKATFIPPRSVHRRRWRL